MHKQIDLSLKLNIKNYTLEPFGENDWFTDNNHLASETLSTSREMNDSIQHGLFQSSTIEITPQLRPTLQHEWMGNALVLVLIGIVILWFLMPNRQLLLQNWRQAFEKPGESSYRKAGVVFSFFFFLNYLFVVVLFAVLTFTYFIPEVIQNISPFQIFLYTAVVLVAYSLYKLLFISFTGYVFETQTAAQQQIRLYLSQNDLTGFIIMGLLFLILFTGGGYLFYFGLFILLISNLIKWFQTIAIGKIVTQFKLYHLIIYLCTLEIIPLLLLFKLMNF